MHCWGFRRHKVCETCHVEIVCYQGNLRWCNACRGAAKKERERLYRMKMRRLAKVGK